MTIRRPQVPPRPMPLPKPPPDRIVRDDVPAPRPPALLVRPPRDWLREAISDDSGSADIAYVSLFVVCGAVLGTISFVCLMSAISYWRCIEVLTATPPILCRFDPLPIGQAVGLICGGFGAALGALAGYMAATRVARAPLQPPPVTTTATATIKTES